MLSKKLVKEVLKELRYLPRHALVRLTSNSSRKIYPHQKHLFGVDKKQYLCWFTPKDNIQNHIIIFYHGGGWTFGTPEVFSNRAQLFVDKGYHVIMPSHRKLPLNGYKQIRKDLILTLKKVNEIMKEKGLLQKKIILGGMSSGGNLAGLLLLDSTLLSDTGFTADVFAGAFFCGAPVNLEGMTDSFVVTRYAGKKNSENFKNASPINHLPETFSKPVLVIHGTEDGLVSYQSTVDFVKELDMVSTVPVEFYPIKNGSHLKAISWAYSNNEIRKKILDWLESV